MASIFTLAITVLQAVASLLGIITNGFMLGVNLSDWKHSRCLAASDYFICAVGFSNLSLQIWSEFSWFCNIFMNFNLFCRSAYALKMISIQCSLTVSGLLSVFYCTKILTFNNALFCFYRRHFLRSYRKIIIYSVILCIVMGWPLVWIGEKPPGQDEIFPFSNNSYIINYTPLYEKTYFGTYRVLLLAFGYTIPLVLTITSACLIIASLRRHTNRMRDVLNTRHEAFIDALLNAGFTIFSLFLLFAVCFTFAIINIIQLFNDRDPGFLLCQLVFMLYAPSLSFVLIRGNCKLKNAAAKVREKIMCTLMPRGWMKEDAPVNNIEH